jgi:hypothetical protein
MDHIISCKKCGAYISVGHLRLSKQQKGPLTTVQLDMEPPLEFKSDGIDTFLECPNPKCGKKNVIVFFGKEWDIVDP